MGIFRMGIQHKTHWSLFGLRDLTYRVTNHALATTWSSGPDIQYSIYCLSLGLAGCAYSTLWTG